MKWLSPRLHYEREEIDHYKKGKQTNVIFVKYYFSQCLTYEALNMFEAKICLQTYAWMKSS